MKTDCTCDAGFAEKWQALGMDDANQFADASMAWAFKHQLTWFANEQQRQLAIKYYKFGFNRSGRRLPGRSPSQGLTERKERRYDQ
jgi:hypothetical protein